MIRLTQAVRLSLLSNIARRCSSSFQFLDLKNTDEGYSIIEMHKNPVNSFSLEFVKELVSAVDEVERTNGSRGLILTSSLKTFSAGVDFMEIYNPDQERFNMFWSATQELSLRLYSSPLVTISAINGAAAGGGCGLSMCCDYRIMADGKFPIGFTESLVGVRLPFWMCKLFGATIGYRNAEKFLTLGTLLNPHDALKVGVIDAITSSDDLMDVAATEMKKWLRIPEMGRVKTKELMRKEIVQKFVEDRQRDLEDVTQIVCSPAVQKSIGRYFKSFGQKAS